MEKISRFTIANKEFNEDELADMIAKDNVDDSIYNVLLSLNNVLDLGVDFDDIEHTPLIIESREALIEVLKSFK